MKKIALVALLISAFTAGVSARGKQPIAFEKVPEVVQEEVQKYFLPLEIQLITVKKVAPRKFEYTFSMEDATQIKYSNKAVLLEVENEKGVLPVFIPEKILTYVLETFPNATITSYEAASGKKVIELNDEMVLVFNKKGKFLRIED
jgi:acyl-CoA synthetase (AMP-forming)/AMP-acid ligase II